MDPHLRIIEDAGLCLHHVDENGNYVVKLPPRDAPGTVMVLKFEGFDPVELHLACVYAADQLRLVDTGTPRTPPAANDNDPFT